MTADGHLHGLGGFFDGGCGAAALLSPTWLLTSQRPGLMLWACAGKSGNGENRLELITTPDSAGYSVHELAAAPDDGHVCIA